MTDENVTGVFPPKLADLQKVLPQRITRMLALVDLARALPPGDCGLAPADHSTDRDDKLSALLHCLTAELEALHMEVSGDL